MHANEELISRFYTAFQQKDGRSMAALYHADATFRDGAFALKSGKEVGAMWQYLIQNGKDLHLTFGEIKADDNSGSARWDAYYTFSKTGRKVHNIIHAKFEFKDGLIYRHRDHFNFWRWSRQALGLPGLLLGWSGYLQNKVRATAMKGLKQYIAASGDMATS